MVTLAAPSRKTGSILPREHVCPPHLLAYSRTLAVGVHSSSVLHPWVGVCRKLRCLITTRFLQREIRGAFFGCLCTLLCFLLRMTTRRRNRGEMRGNGLEVYVCKHCAFICVFISKKQKFRTVVCRVLFLLVDRLRANRQHVLVQVVLARKHSQFTSICFPQFVLVKHA